MRGGWGPGVLFFFFAGMFWTCCEGKLEAGRLFSAGVRWTGCEGTLKAGSLFAAPKRAIPLALFTNRSGTKSVFSAGVR